MDGDIDDEAAAMLGPGVPLQPGTETTLTVANGTEIDFDGDTYWSVQPGSHLIVSGESQETVNTVTSLVTGESWTFPAIDRSQEPNALAYIIVGSWLIGGTDETLTDLRIINTETGAERLTSEILGSPFEQARVAIPLGPWPVHGSTPLILSFVPVGHQGAGVMPSVVIMPSGDPADAYALDDATMLAGARGAITRDGSKVAYVAFGHDGTFSVRVLEGFTGELIAEHPLPESPDGPQLIGLTADDSKLILHDSQRVWTLALDGGEITTVFESEGTIDLIALDPTTRTALVQTGRSDSAELVWIDPASGEAKTVGLGNAADLGPPQGGWALVMTRQNTSADYAVLDMVTGELATDPVSLPEAVGSSDAGITEASPDGAGVFVVQARPGKLLVLDGPGGRAFEMAVPTGGDSGEQDIAVDVSPNRACIVYTRTAGDPGTSWVAALEPGAGWTEMPFELIGWLEVPEG